MYLYTKMRPENDPDEWHDDSYQVDPEGKVILTPEAVQLLDRDQAQAVANAIYERFRIRGKLKSTTPHTHEWEELGDGGMYSCTLCDEDGDMCMNCEEISSGEKCQGCGVDKGVMLPSIPQEMKKPGIIWAVKKGEFIVYAETKKHLTGIPDELEGVKVQKNVTGKIMPAQGGTNGR